MEWKIGEKPRFDMEMQCLEPGRYEMDMKRMDAHGLARVVVNCDDNEVRWSGLVRNSSEMARRRPV